VSSAIPTRVSPAARILSRLIALYRRVLSPIIPARCRYHPTCSEYALQAIEVHGAIRGTALALRRIGRCHPWAPGGIDPVPERKPVH
jgi:uncharacterized protein